MKLLLISLCIIFDIVYIICNTKQKNIIGLFSKTFAALCFICLGYLGYKVNSTAFNYFILIGLILDGFGDLFLAIRNIFAKNVSFLIGTLCFLAGHILYIKGLYILNNNYLLINIVLGLIIGSIIFRFYCKVCKLNKVLHYVGYVYISTIIIMVLMSIGVFLTTFETNSLIFMIGSLFFVSSDLILVLYNFSKRKKWMHPTYSLLYFIGQILISFSLHI